MLLCCLILLLGCGGASEEADRFFLRGNVALEEGRNEEAIRLYDEAIAKNPKLKDAYNNKGVAFYREGKFQEAIDVYTEVLSNVDADYIDAKRNRVNASMGVKNFEMALEDLAFLGEVYPDSSFVDMLRGLVQTELKDYLEANLSFSWAYKKDPTNVEPLANIANMFFYMGRNDVSRKYLDSAENLDPTLSSIYNTRSMIAAREGEYEEALTFANKAIELDPDIAYYYNNRGYAYLRTGQLDKAEADINISIKRDIYNAWAYRNKGIFYNMKEDYESAERNFKLAEKYEPALEHLYSNYGDALFKLDRLDEACNKWWISVDRFENESRENFAKYCQHLLSER